jgi:hypothetical protein
VFRTTTSSDTMVTKGRNRHETRTAEVFSAASAVADTEWEPLIKDIVRLSRDVLHRNPTTGVRSSTSEIAYYVVNCPIPAHRAAAAIRSHRHIESVLEKHMERVNRRSVYSPSQRSLRLRGENFSAAEPCGTHGLALVPGLGDAILRSSPSWG